MSNPWIEVDKKIVSEIYTSSEPMDNLKMLCDVHGSRFPGTPGDLGSVKYMVEKLKDYGIENAHYESYKIPGWRRAPAKLTMMSLDRRASRGTCSVDIAQHLQVVHRLRGRVYLGDDLLVDLDPWVTQN